MSDFIANGMYRMCQKLGTDPTEVRPQVERVLGPLQALRRNLAPVEQRDLDLGLMQWMRRSSALTAVIGAGVTIDAGGPSWPALVNQLLEVALTTGHEIAEMRLNPGSTDTHRTFTRHVSNVRRFIPEQEAGARSIHEAIRSKSEDSETLMRGAQLCLDLFGQHMFARLTDIQVVPPATKKALWPLIGKYYGKRTL